MAAAVLAAEDLLKVETGVTPLRLVRGEEGRVVLKMGIRRGVAVSAQPAFTIEFSPSEELVFAKNFFTASDLNVEVMEMNGKAYLNLRKPIEIPFTVNPKARRGIHVLEGKVKYFAYSLSGDWCLKTTAKFKATFSTRLAVPKDRP